MIKVWIATATKSATPAMVRAYEAGRAARQASGLTNARKIQSAHIYGQLDCVAYDDAWEMRDALHACYQAGVHGADMPRWVRGWRFGSVPASGRSRNHRDNVTEQGVSVMGVDGAEDETDGTFALFNDVDRERVTVEGWLVTHARGSDGEPLLVDAVAV